MARTKQPKRGARTAWRHTPPSASPLPAGAGGAYPLVAIVGRPNVGKSTLFNRLAGKNVAIVEDAPGVTRDRHYADADALGRPYVLVDTGGFDPEGRDPRSAGIVRQVRLALEECDAVVCVLDATAEPLDADREAVRLLRQSGKPVHYVANKADSSRHGLHAVSHYELGLDAVLPVSAVHGRGIGELEEALAASLPAQPDESESEVDADVPRVALVGRPNAGKSSLLNRLLREDRHLVDAEPGTTVDSVDTLLERNGGRYVLIDTAGIRRKSAKKEAVEAVSIYHAIRAIERSDVVVLTIDARQGPADQDAKIAGLAHDRGRGLVIALNKIDLLETKERREVRGRTRDLLRFAKWAPLLETSAATGRGVDRLLRTVDEVVDEHRKRIPTAELNRFFEEVLAHHPPPTHSGREVRLYYVTQAETSPPTFVVTTNEPKGIYFSYQRYVINQIRERFGFGGTPIRVRYRPRSGHEPDVA